MRSIKRISAVIILLVFGCFMFLSLQNVMGVTFPSVFGWGYAQVASGSMEPEIHVGELVFVNKTAPISEGDIVMYLDEQGRLITHRAVKVYTDMIITQGDANDYPDLPITGEQIIGKVAYHTEPPLSGISTPAVRYVCVITFLIAAALVIRWAFIEVGSIFKKETCNKENSK